ncbi:hypothetical protein [Brevibacillus laterosporus]|uniref:Uncharacterized protein n=1 Tax=Brevibacillus laterosporus TaxID=1465 RepID=A0AAP8U707_BRELA|nr:hypothetical protein [Brevibacillus laterosporus]MBG9776191.1 hypothetical protein [Brevibacillus laterosporus]PPB12841.1 hypothetical protein C4A77_00205 [Brevibacillus laterosporus]
MDKKSFFKLQLNQLEQTDDPTVLRATFIIHDFEKSWHEQIVSKEVSLENAHTLLNKPIVAKYYPVSQFGTSTDALGGHEMHLGYDRFGEETVKTDTVPIGVFTTGGYLLTVNENGEEKEVLAADATLWRLRFKDICDLLLEWYSQGVEIYSSVEFLYSNYSFKDGIEYIESPIFYDGHALLNSEERNGHKIVAPAYDSSKLLSFNDLKQFNRLVAQAIKQEHKEGESMFFKKVCEMSHDDIRSKLYNQLSIQMTEQEYNSSYIVNVYDTSFIFESWNEHDGVKHYKVDYGKNGDTLTVNMDSKTEVVEQKTWITTTEVEQMQAQLNEANKKAEQLATESQTLSTSLNQLTQDKGHLEKQFNEVSDKIISLSSQNQELQTYKEKYEAEQLEKSLNEKKAYYAEKFEAVNGKEKFDSDEVQNLIKLSLNSTPEGTDAALQLNTMLVDMVITAPKKQEGSFIREYASVTSNLLPKADDFESRYGA